VSGHPSSKPAISASPVEYGFWKTLPAGYTVMEVLAQVAGTLRRPVAHIVGARRPGDPVALVADVNRAATLLGWQPRFGLAEMVSSACAAGPDPDQSQEG